MLQIRLRSSPLLWTGVISAQPRTIGGANLFAPSWQSGKDAERALPMIAFYKTPKSGTSAEPGALVRAEPATDCFATRSHGNPGFCITPEALTTLTGWHRASRWFIWPAT